MTHYYHDFKEKLSMNSEDKLNAIPHILRAVNRFEMTDNEKEFLFEIRRILGKNGVERDILREVDITTFEKVCDYLLARIHNEESFRETLREIIRGRRAVVCFPIHSFDSFKRLVDEVLARGYELDAFEQCIDLMNLYGNFARDSRNYPFETSENVQHLVRIGWMTLTLIQVVCRWRLDLLKDAFAKWLELDTDTITRKGFISETEWLDIVNEQINRCKLDENREKIINDILPIIIHPMFSQQNLRDKFFEVAALHRIKLAINTRDNLDLMKSYMSFMSTTSDSKE